MKPTSVFALLLFILGALAPTVFAATGSIAGNVGNAGTGRLLEGAKVELPKLGLSTVSHFWKLRAKAMASITLSMVLWPMPLAKCHSL